MAQFYYYIAKFAFIHCLKDYKSLLKLVTANKIIKIYIV